MSWRILISEKDKKGFIPIEKKFVSRNKKELGTQLIDWMCKNGFLSPSQLAGEALLRDWNSFKNANGKTSFYLKIDMVDSSQVDEKTKTQ